MSETVTNFRRITRSPLALAMLFARKIEMPIRCHYCVKMKTCDKCNHVEDYSYCQEYIKEWMEKEAE